GVELELLTDYDQHLFIEKGMRGGISMVSKRYAKANNPLVEGYDSEKPSSHILYLDANNLYGWAMSQYLPTSGFRWVDASECQQLAKTIAEQPADSEEGYILEVDLEYPAPLHKAHNAYPLAPERMVDVGVSARPYSQSEWRWGGAYRGRKTGPEPPQQGLLCAPLSESPAIYVSGYASDCSPSCPLVQAEPQDGALHPDEY
ncbi:MAG: hypothetical protein AB2692_23470, partial [Candidatus Thiodiazotropha sp.]